MDTKEIIQEKIEIIKNEVDFILEKYHGDSDDSAGVDFKNVESVKQDIEKALWFAVENYEHGIEKAWWFSVENYGTALNVLVLTKTPTNCFCEFYNGGSRFFIKIRGEHNLTQLEIDVHTGDLIEGYNEKNVGGFEAFDVKLSGSFEITKNGLFW